MRDTTAVLYLPPKSASLRYRAYLDKIGSQTLIEWWVERVRAVSSAAPLIIVCHTDQEKQILAALFPSGGPDVFKTQNFSQRRTLAEVSRKIQTPLLALLPLGFALAPDDLLERTRLYHVSSGNTTTRVLGLPLGTTPIIFSKKLLVALDECGVPGLPNGTVEALEALARAARSVKQDPPFPIHGSSWDARSPYAVDMTQLPREIEITHQDHTEVLRQVCKRLAEAPLTEDPLRALRLWKEMKVEEADRRYNAIKNWDLPVSRKTSDASKKLILFVSNPSAFSGAEESLCQMMSHLDADRFEKLALIGRDGTFADRAAEAGAKVIVPDTEFGAMNIENLFYGLSLLENLKPDLVHLNNPTELSMLAAANLLHIPVVLHVRNGAMEPYAPFVKSVDAVISISEFLKREILAFDLDPKKVHLIPDEADMDYYRNQGFDKQQIRQEFGVPPQAKVALLIARFANNKRHDVMMNAAALVRKSIPSFHLVMKSDIYNQQEADISEAVQSQIRRLELSKSITWLRFVPDIRKLHAMADVLVLCSDREGMGRCIVEAMAMELPVVVTDGGGSHELTGNKERGYVAKAGDAQDLAKQIIEALTNETQSKAMAKAARQFAETHLNARITAQKVAQIYNQLL